jgi:hypothetical protein
LSGFALYDVLVNGGADSARAGVHLGENIASAATAVSAVARNCELTAGGVGYLQALHVVAENSLGNLRPERAADLVNAAGGRCKLPPAEAALSLAVYKAVANRDGAAMSAAAQAAWIAVPSDDDRRRAYLMGTMLLGELARGRNAEAASLWDRYQGAALFGGRTERLPAWLTLLRKLAFHGGSAPARASAG